MLEKGGNVKLIDFGASKQLNAQKGGATTSTAISYTNGYAPREQMEQNYDKFGPWTDIYALGATLYNLLTNKRPPLPSDIDDDDSNDKHLSLPFSKRITNNMKEFVLKLMQTNRKYRPQTISNVQSLMEQQTGFSDDYHETPFEDIVPESAENEETIIASPSIVNRQNSQKESHVATKLRTGDSEEKERGNSIDSIATYFLNEYWLTVFICFVISVLFWYFGCGNPNNFYGGDRSNAPINMLGGFYSRGGIAVFGFFAIFSYISYIIINYLKIPKAIVHLVLVGGCIIYLLLSFS
jgi:serine/threonine protein kinase